MDLIEQIFSDHERLTSLFDQLENTDDRHLKTRIRLFDQLKTEMIAHTKGEERFVYPLLEGSKDERIMMCEAAEEHHLVRIVLQEMDQLPVDSERWVAKLTVLRELFEHHIDEEEEEIIPVIEDLLTDEQAEDLGHKLGEYQMSIRQGMLRRAA